MSDDIARIIIEAVAFGACFLKRLNFDYIELKRATTGGVVLRGSFRLAQHRHLIRFLSSPGSAK